MKTSSPSPSTEASVSPEDQGVERPYLRLATQIGHLLVQKGIKVGERLPSERTLADHFEVSRTAVREAIIALELQGMLEVRGGSGAYVVQLPSATGSTARAGAGAPFMPSAGPGPFELLRARCLIESEIAAVAAETRKDSDLDLIFEALADMRLHMDDKALNEAADRRFHLRIAESTGNSVLLQMVTAMWDQAKSPVWAKIDQHFHTTALRVSSQEDHQRIFDALMKRDPQAARAAMRAHLERVIQEFAQAWR
ncbi:GntR family transcriptional regulator [Comamonas sp. BIGb0124]|uniref:FadR/GntR family transcriptional regulator n=1 Tax=Comamonas sp. BIGb0124 TaxID=2485130 RepID=UPI000F499C13|nr:FadR/GntR family transcriptional regulator [Comamonas sp. BIGb0124]ROR25097.1 GntR family transcriptional regulator [Comamonas sp. BIGb0124]